MSVIIIKCCDGSDYVREKEFIPGSFDNPDSSIFVKAYTQFALDHGYTLDAALDILDAQNKKEENADNV